MFCLYFQGVYQTVKPLSPAPSTELGLNHMTLGTLGSQNMYPPIAPPSQRVRETGDYQTQHYPFYQGKSTSYPLNNSKMLPSTHMHSNALFDSSKLTGPSSLNYTGMKSQQLPSYAVQKDSSQYSKGVMNDGTANKQILLSSNANEWKSSLSQQYRANSVQGILSRPFSCKFSLLKYQKTSHFVKQLASL